MPRAGIHTFAGSSAWSSPLAWPQLCIHAKRPFKSWEQSVEATPICFKLSRQWVWFLFCFALASAGNKRAAKMAFGVGLLINVLAIRRHRD